MPRPAGACCWSKPSATSGAATPYAMKAGKSCGRWYETKAPVGNVILLIRPPRGQPVAPVWLRGPRGGGGGPAGGAPPPPPPAGGGGGGRGARGGGGHP